MASFIFTGRLSGGRGADAGVLRVAEAVPSDVWFEQPALKAVTAKIEAMLLPSDFGFMTTFPLLYAAQQPHRRFLGGCETVPPVIDGLNVARVGGQWRFLVRSPSPPTTHA